MEAEKEKDPFRELLANMINSRYPEYELDFPLGNRRTLSIVLSEIRYIEAAGELCYFYLKNKTRSKVSIAQTIGECQVQLRPYCFLRIHRQYLINLSYLDQMQSKTSLQLRCGKELPVARRRRTEVASTLAEYGL